MRKSTCWVALTMDKVLGIYPTKQAAIRDIDRDYNILTRKRLHKGEYEYEYGYPGENSLGVIWVTTEELARKNGADWSMDEYKEKERCGTNG